MQQDHWLFRRNAAKFLFLAYMLSANIEKGLLWFFIRFGGKIFFGATISASYSRIIGLHLKTKTDQFKSIIQGFDGIPSPQLRGGERSLLHGGPEKPLHVIVLVPHATLVHQPSQVHDAGIQSSPVIAAHWPGAVHIVRLVLIIDAVVLLLLLELRH